jgi:hypothetical protein
MRFHVSCGPNRGAKSTPRFPATPVAKNVAFQRRGLLRFAANAFLCFKSTVCHFSQTIFSSVVAVVAVVLH